MTYIISLDYDSHLKAQLFQFAGGETVTERAQALLPNPQSVSKMQDLNLDSPAPNTEIFNHF